MNNGRIKPALFISIILIIVLVFIIGLFLLFRREEHVHEFLLYGNVDVRQVDIGFRVAGKVDKLFYEEGDLVTKGTLMATLEKNPYDSQERQAIFNFNSAKIKYENAERIFKRREELVKIGGVSKEDFDDSRANYEQYRADYESTLASYQVAKDNLDYTNAYAPVDGIILSRILEPGSVANVSNPVYTLSVLSPVWIRAYVDEPRLGQVWFGKEAEIYTDLKGGKVYKGKIGFISPVAEFTPKTVQTTELRTDLVYRLRIYVDNPDQFLKQGMPVTVKLKKHEEKKEDRDTPCPN